MKSGELNMRDFEKQISLLLAHDVSDEKRDDHGRWSGGGSNSSGKSKSISNTNRAAKKKNEPKDDVTFKEAFNNQLKIDKENRLKKSLKRKVATRAALIGGLYGGMATVANRAGAIKKRHVAIATAIGAGLGAAQATYKHKKDTDANFEKKADKAERNTALGLLSTGAIYEAQYLYRNRIPKKVNESMLKEIITNYNKLGGKLNYAKGVSNPTVRKVILQKIKNHVFHHIGQVNTKNITPNPKIYKLAKMIHVEDKFFNAPLKQRIRLSKAIRSQLGVKSFSEHIRHVASKVVNKFKPYKVVHIAGLLT